MPRTRAAAIRAMASAARDDPRLFDPRGDMDATVARLARIQGIGPWTANYIAMRALGEADAFITGDAALLRALGGIDAATLARRAEGWRPWRAYAALHLWTADGDGDDALAA